MMSVAIHAQMPFTRWQSTSPSLHGSGGPTIEDSPFHSSAGLMDFSMLQSTSVVCRAIPMPSTSTSTVDVMCSSTKSMGGMRTLVVGFERSASRRSKIFELPVQSIPLGRRTGSRSAAR